MKKAARAIVVKGDSLLVMHRSKFGQEYYTLVGGGVDAGETIEQALHRELAEETGVRVTVPRLVFVEEAGRPYGTQYVYLCKYRDGEPMLHPEADEAKINELGQNLYTPMWLHITDLPKVPFVSKTLKAALLHSLQDGFPLQPLQLTEH
jgi:ADP-ribose pyrophosphatase YjhB (NUDIX family)